MLSCNRRLFKLFHRRGLHFLLVITPQDMNLLADTSLLKGCDADTLETMRALWHRKAFPTGAVLMTSEQPSEVIYVILSGSMSVAVDGWNGTNVVVGLRGPGETLGEVSLADNQKRSATVTSVEPSVLFWISRAELELHLRQSPILALNLARILAQRLRLATAQIQALSSLGVRGRIAAQLLTLAREFGHAQETGAVFIPISLPQSDLGAMVGATRVSVNQALVNWKKRRLIAIDAHSRVTILQMSALEKELQ